MVIGGASVRAIEAAGHLDRNRWRELGETGVFSITLPEADGMAAVRLDSPPKTIVVRSMPSSVKARLDMRTTGGISPRSAASTACLTG